MTGKHELRIVLFFMPSRKPVERLPESIRVKERKDYGKNEKRFQRADGQRGDKLRQEDGTHAADLGIVAGRPGLQYRIAGSGQV